MCKTLTDDIISYLGYLNKTCNLDISVNFNNEVLSLLSRKELFKFSNFNSHNNPYCIAVKGKRHIDCIHYKKSIFMSCPDNCFCSECPAGVYEYIYPIYKNEKMIAYIAISGYRKGSSSKGCIDNALWNSALSDNQIPYKLCDTLIPPLRCMIERFYELYSGNIQKEYNLLLQFLDEYHTNITLSDVCKHFGRSSSHISHMFKNKSGMSINTYCNNLKLQDAKHLLISTDLTVTEISFTVGFNDTSYFISMFKKKFGISPLQYRKGLRK